MIMMMEKKKKKMKMKFYVMKIMEKNNEEQCSESDRTASSFSSSPSSSKTSKASQPPPPPPCIILATSQRPMVVPWVNPMLEKVEALSWIPLVVLSPFMWWFGALRGGASYATGSGTQRLSIEMIDALFESSSQPLSAATVSLSSSDIEIYSAKIIITAKMNGIRYYMYHWFWSTAFLSIGTILFTECTWLALAYLIFHIYTSEEDDPIRQHRQRNPQSFSSSTSSSSTSSQNVSSSGHGLRRRTNSRVRTSDPSDHQSGAGHDHLRRNDMNNDSGSTSMSGDEG
mmetsp:Transcript_31702/g.40728  ORF Transcript_31702/g.40728 Transcript_31702/m.40728 type:complete len:285 (+) Transcript_31702:197-1051(+)